MDETNLINNPPTPPVAPAGPKLTAERPVERVAGPMPTQPELKPEKKWSKMILLPLACLVLGMMAVIVWSSLGKTPSTTQAPPKTYLPPTPTPERKLSAVATQGAFLSLQDHVASLSASINNFILDDPSLTPPVLDLPLGF